MNLPTQIRGFRDDSKPRSSYVCHLRINPLQGITALLEASRPTLLTIEGGILNWKNYI